MTVAKGIFEAADSDNAQQFSAAVEEDLVVEDLLARLDEQRCRPSEGLVKWWD